MNNAVFSSDTPSDLPGASVQPEDMARVTESDWTSIRTIARQYCRVVDGTRSRKRMDGNATIAGGRFGKYGTGDVSDDVSQDAVFLFAQNLAKMIRAFEPASLAVATREADSWLYVTRDGRTRVVTRHTLRYWAVRDAAARNGYRLDIPADEIVATPGAQLMRGVARIEFLAVATHLARNSEAIWRTAWGDGKDFPVLGDVIDEGNKADDIGRAGILSHVAQKRHGGTYGSRRAVIRTRDAAQAEMRELSRRLDEARETLTYRSARNVNDSD
ncbi:MULTISPECIES: hypothetical protein [unclassified Frankia]|uniref:hypothetical protein n=1 Tax=unclassified Frankia TaxID=2632575 RepID=UPI002AD20F22|nr:MULTISPECIES: hypothetical protein [unclassified Frankia]